MKKVPHSTAPWRVSPTDDTVVIDADICEVAAIDGDYNRPDTWPIMEANARLIASAPELLEAGIAQTDILRRAQAILTQYLIGPPNGIGRDAAITALLALLDGPDQRDAQDKWNKASAKALGE